MKAPRAVRLAVPCLALLMCSGCFDLLQEIWLEPGGGGRARLEVILPKSLLAMGQIGGEDILVSAREDAANAKAELAKDPDIRRFDYRSEEGPGIFKLIYEVESSDASKLQAAQARALASLARNARPREPGSQQSPLSFTVKRKMGLGLEFHGVVATSGASGTGDPDEPDRSNGRERRRGEELGEALAGAMMGGHNITVRVHAPYILSSNGTLDGTRGSVEWKIPLSALMERSFRQELTAEALVVDWKVGLAGAAGALVLLGIILGRMTARRR